MPYLRRKIDAFLAEWKSNPNRFPLIIRGARQIGKTESIRHFLAGNYEKSIEINFVEQKRFRDIFNEGYEVDSIIRNISAKDPSLEFVPGRTAIFFDEIQALPDAATSLKFFKEDSRYDVICSGSMMGLSYREIESNSVGFKTDFEMETLDFEEFLWALGYKDEQIEGLYAHLRDLMPFSASEMSAMLSRFQDYFLLGGLPGVVLPFIESGNFSGSLARQRQILSDYEEDITKYAKDLDVGKILDVYRKIPAFLGKDNKKFQISKVRQGARSREYVGVMEWLDNSGIISRCFCMNVPELPLKGNYDPANYKVYFRDTGLLVASLDDEAQDDLRGNRNFNAYKGALYENIVADMLHKQGYPLYFWRNDRGSIEMDFFIRDYEGLIPVEVKAKDGPTASLNALLDHEEFPEIHYGIKLARKNIGFNGRFYTIPYFMAPWLKRFVRERKKS